MKMRRSFAYSLPLLLLVTSFTGCTKSDDDDDDDKIGNWVTSTDFEGDARSEAVSFTIGTKTYLATGATSTERFNDLWEYDNDLNYWTQKADLPTNGRNSAVAFVAKGKAYVGTGYDGANELDDFWEYNPTNNKWTQKAKFGGVARYDAVAFSLNNKGYVCSGFDGNYLKDLWEYTPGATDNDPGSWTQKASLGGSKRSEAMSFVLNNQGYVVSGNNNGSALNDVWAYNEGTNTWTQKRKITDANDDEEYDDDYSSIPRINGVAFTMGNLAYITTGENGSVLSTTWEYNESQDQWTEKTAFEGSGREGSVAFTLGDRGFVLTGRNGSLSYDNMFEFHPNEEEDEDD